MESVRPDEVPFQLNYQPQDVKQLLRWGGFMVRQLLLVVVLGLADDTPEPRNPRTVLRLGLAGLAGTLLCLPDPAQPSLPSGPFPPLLSAQSSLVWSYSVPPPDTACRKSPIGASQNVWMYICPQTSTSMYQFNSLACTLSVQQALSSALNS